MIKICLAFGLLFSTSAFAAQPCNAGGADPLDCKTKDGKYEILLSQNRNITGLGISATAFCNAGYLKIDGVEVNGKFGAEVPDDAAVGIDYVDSVTSELGVRVANPARKQVIVPKTVIGFVLSAQGSAMLKDIDSGNVFVFSDNTAQMYLKNGDKQSGYQQLTCQ